jgi:hypothetical protein
MQMHENDKIARRCSQAIGKQGDLLSLSPDM